MPKFTLNNKELSFQKGEDILQVALREKNFIPHYCAHESLSRVATCRSFVSSRCSRCWQRQGYI